MKTNIMNVKIKFTHTDKHLTTWLESEGVTYGVTPWGILLDENGAKFGPSQAAVISAHLERNGFTTASKEFADKQRVLLLVKKEMTSVKSLAYHREPMSAAAQRHNVGSVQFGRLSKRGAYVDESGQVYYPSTTVLKLEDDNE